MRRVNDRVRGPEDRFGDREPAPAEVQSNRGRVVDGAWAKRRGEPVGDDAQRGQDTIARWVMAGGVDLENEAERARQKLRNLDRARE